MRKRGLDWHGAGGVEDIVSENADGVRGTPSEGDLMRLACGQRFGGVRRTLRKAEKFRVEEEIELCDEDHVWEVDKLRKSRKAEGNFSRPDR